MHTWWINSENNLIKALLFSFFTVALLTLNIIGTYHTYPNSPALRTHNAFTLKQFLDANTPHVPVYLGGKLSYNDPQLNMHYEMVPEGMVSRFVPTSATGGAVTSVENVAVADDVTAERFVNNTHSGIVSPLYLITIFLARYYFLGGFDGIKYILVCSYVHSLSFHI